MAAGRWLGKATAGQPLGKTTTAEQWQQGDSSQAMAGGRRLGKATAGRPLGRAMAVGRAAAAAAVAGQGSGGSKATTGLLIGRQPAGQEQDKKKRGAAVGRCSATSGARHDATAERGRTRAVARQGDGRAATAQQQARR